MSVFRKKSNDQVNRIRLQKLVATTQTADAPKGWGKQSFAIGGLTEIGFSKENPELLLVISTQGYGVFDCDKLQRVDRDSNIEVTCNTYELWTNGIGILANEKISVAGIYGGGLPLVNQFGDYLRYMAPEWPRVTIIFEPDGKSVYKKEEAKACFTIYNDYEVVTFGFSYSGNYFVIATSSDIYIYRKELL